MSTPIELEFSLANFPLPFKGTQEDFKELIARSITAGVANNFILGGRIGGAMPSSDIGPWANGQSWETWNADAGKYLYNTMAVSNPSARDPVGNALLIKIDGSPTANRTLLLQDKDGAMALNSDLYTPRHTVAIPPVGAYIVDWNLSNTFYCELGQDLVLDMRNSRHGQKIYIAILNPAGYLVTFINTVGFSNGIQPFQTQYAGGTLTDVTAVNTSNLIISEMAKFVKADEGLTITTAGNTPIPTATTIAHVLSATHALLSNACVAGGTNVTATIASRPLTGRIDLWILKNVGGAIYGRVIQNYDGLLRPAGSPLPFSIGAATLPASPPPNSPDLEPPIFLPNPGQENLVAGDLVITMVASSPAVAIRYTTDGTIPTATTGFLVSGVIAAYTLSQGSTVEINAISLAADNSVSAYRRALYSNVLSIPDNTITGAPDNPNTGQARLDIGNDGSLISTNT